MLDDKKLRKKVTRTYYEMMRKIAKISNQNLVPNSDAYISSGANIDQDNEFYWIDDSYKKGKGKFELSY